MRVLLINTSERIGGAAVACSRLMNALKNNGIKAKMLVRDKQTDQITVVALDSSWRLVWRFVWERLVILAANRFKKHRLFEVDIANTGTDVTSLPEFQQADVIHLHWVNQGMLSLRGLDKILSSGKPIVWTMHDMWPFTGICHYSGACQRYREEGCHHCPMLYGGGGRRDLSVRTFLRKQALYRGRRITFVACSQWLADLAHRSILLDGQTVMHIPNAINVNLFSPHDKQEARRRCLLPDDLQLVLFGAVKITDPRKGVSYLVEACRLLADRYPEWRERVAIVAFGNQSRQLQDMLPLKVYPLDFVKDEHRLVDIYNAVDLYVTPSLEDNLPNTIMEAMACGTPCVGFQVGGIPEMIDHLHNGYVARYRSAEDLAEGIRWTLTDPGYPSLCEEAARKAVTHYSERAIAKRFIDLYNKVTGRWA